MLAACLPRPSLNTLRLPALVPEGFRRHPGANQVAPSPPFDLAEYVIDSNVTRRNMSTGARAMSTALVLEADGRRKDGRWKRGSVNVGNTGSRNTWQDGDLEKTGSGQSGWRIRQ